MARKYRAQILLEPDQRAALAGIAALEGRSISEVAREIIDRGLDDRAQEGAAIRQTRALALQRLDDVRESVKGAHGVYDGNLVEAARADRERQLSRAQSEGVN